MSERWVKATRAEDGTTIYLNMANAIQVARRKPERVDMGAPDCTLVWFSDAEDIEPREVCELPELLLPKPDVA